MDGTFHFVSILFAKPPKYMAHNQQQRVLDQTRCIEARRAHLIVPVSFVVALELAKE